MLNKMSSKLITTIVGMLCILTTPISSQQPYGNCCNTNQCAPPPCCNPCEDGLCCPGNKLFGINRDLAIFLGAAAVGAIAGVASAAAFRERGRSGADGADGISPFTSAPVGETLSFNFVLNETLALPGLIVPFVETPDGRTLYGTPFAPLIGLSQTITDPTPVYGSYVFGLASSPTLVSLDVSAVVVVDPSRAGSPDTLFSLPFLIGILADEQQVTDIFVFGPPGTLP